MRILLFLFLLNVNDNDTCTDQYLKMIFNPATKESYVFIPVLRNGDRKVLVTTNKTLYNFVKKQEPNKSDTSQYMNYIVDTYKNSYMVLNGPLNVKASVFDFIDTKNLYKEKYKGRFDHFYKQYTTLNPQETARFPKLGSKTKGQEYYIFQVYFEGNTRVALRDGVFYLNSYNCEKKTFE